MFLSFLKKKIVIKKINIYTTGSPFNGTLAYSPKCINELIKDRIVSVFEDTFFSEKLRKRVVTIYNDILINSHRFY